jgi:predicted ArsR family transcriptional regulator
MSFVSTRWDERFLASTRGRVAALLRLGDRTVDELAGELGLTDNAVRAHLAALERDGLAAQGEPRRSGGKPAFTYQLTPQAERLFPKAYGLILSELVAVLADRLPPDELDAALRDVGHRLASGQSKPTGDRRARIDAAVALLAGLGGAAEIEETNGQITIQGCNCPISAAVEASPDACRIAETLLSDLIGAPVRQACEPGPPPRCRFELPGA